MYMITSKRKKEGEHKLGTDLYNSTFQRIFRVIISQLKQIPYEVLTKSRHIWAISPNFCSHSLALDFEIMRRSDVLSEEKAQHNA